MIASMTGYGDSQRSVSGVTYALELRSLNNRYYKSSIRLPEFIQFLEGDIDRFLHERLTRGSVACAIKTRSESASAAYSVNQAALQSYVKHLQISGLPSGVTPTLDIATLLSLPGVCQMPVLEEADRETMWSLVSQMLEEATEKLIVMRRKEGSALQADLLENCRSMRESVTRIAERAPGVIREYQTRLQQRVSALLAEVELPLAQDDLLREIAIYADRCDISEELSRLRSHLDQFEQICDSKEPAGRKLEFLAQEFLREANTISSKSNDTTIAHLSVDLKSRIDRLKEQVQNVQ